MFIKINDDYQKNKKFLKYEYIDLNNIDQNYIIIPD